ncbi:hypothetical protein D0T53_07435 [Dysgonomonas sp. 216]|uniref:hypothetical protein n=1 Tax=Dysgonomonas sp. 216 TaxID=2302934 RepID=UPI0013D3A8F8|nr:hypothetical protein [Dysgonomonas sp. 216]NDW18745.1 hypothetical protein [Dysgonomonas sp. 216]
MRVKIKYKIAALLVFSITGTGAYNSPADSYYNSQIAQGVPSGELPSQSYYNNHLRAGGGDEWEEDDGPGGTGTGGNTGVGVPLGEACLPALASSMLIYGIYARNKRRREGDNSPVNEHTND